VSIVGVDDHELSETFDVTTVAQPVAAQGASAARWVISHLEGTADPDADLLAVSTHPSRLVLRGSTAPSPPERVPAAD
jgi:DNA-binding LacI/PurR family transcriptional regulator